MSAFVVPPRESESRLSAGDRHLIVQVHNVRLAIPAQVIRSIAVMPEVTHVPNRPPSLRGVLNLRGSVMPVLDLRVRLGMPSYEHENQELIGLLQEREQDHVNWINELKASVREKREFKLARDPHKCKFGKWYDTYVPRNRSVAVISLWRSFDRPHCQIHGVAHEVCQLAERGEHEAAQTLINRTETTALGKLRGLFAELRQTLVQTTREVAVIVGTPRGPLAIAVDEVAVLQGLSERPVDQPPELARGERDWSAGVAYVGNSDQIVSVLNVEQLAPRAA